MIRGVATQIKFSVELRQQVDIQHPMKEFAMLVFCILLNSMKKKDIWTRTKTGFSCSSLLSTTSISVPLSNLSISWAKPRRSTITVIPASSVGLFANYA